jgi:ABC-type bacteriocin/lantibiotic exporter with double-glycine peptidase domain
VGYFISTNLNNNDKIGIISHFFLNFLAQTWRKLRKTKGRAIMRKIFLKQEEEYDCGFAVAAMIIHTIQNFFVSVEELKFKYSSESEMLSLKDIENILGNYFVKTKSYQCDIKELTADSRLPVIMFVKNSENIGHYIVCYEIKNNKMLIADPSGDSLQWIDTTEIAKTFLGVVMIPKKDRQYEFKKIKLNQLNKIFNSEWKKYFIIFVPSFFLNILFIIGSNFAKTYFNTVTTSSTEFVSRMFIAFIVVYLISTLLDFFINQITIKIKSTVMTKITIDFLQRFQNIYIDEYESISIEKWMTKMDSLNFVVNHRFTIFITLPIKFLLFTFSILALGNINLVFILYSLLQNIILFFFSFYFSDKIRSISYKEKNIKINSNILLNDLFFGFESINSKNLNEVFNIKIKNAFNKLEIGKQKIQISYEIIARFFSISSQMIYYAVTFLSVPLIKNNEITIGDLIYYFTLNNYINGFCELILGLIKNRSTLKINLNDLNFIYTVEVKDEKLLLSEKINWVKFENVSKNRNGRLMCQRVNSVIKNNTVVTGPSGVGKSTLFKILEGQFRDYLGNVFINDKNIKDISRKSLKEKIFYLGQYDYLYTDTVFENIKLFKEIDLKKIAQLGLMKILIDHNIMIDKRIKNNGANLSKGQRQIINFMSTFFIQRDLFIIDESLSNVDEVTAEKLLNIFSYLHQNSLIIFCTHNSQFKKYYHHQLEVTQWNE